MKNQENVIFDLIVHSGNARGLLYEALDKAEMSEFKESEKLMEKAKGELVLAHNIQTELIQDDLRGNGKISLLLIHAQDQFMNTMTEQSLIERLIKLQKKID